MAYGVQAMVVDKCKETFCSAHNLTSTSASKYTPDSKPQSHSLDPEHALHITSISNYVVGDSWKPWLHVPTSSTSLLKLDDTFRGTSSALFNNLHVGLPESDSKNIRILY